MVSLGVSTVRQLKGRRKAAIVFTFLAKNGLVPSGYEGYSSNQTPVHHPWPMGHALEYSKPAQMIHRGEIAMWPLYIWKYIKLS